MKQILALCGLVLLLAACQPAAAQTALSVGPVAWIDAPLEGAVLPLKPYTIVTHATFPKGVSSMELSANGQVLHTVSVPPSQVGQSLAQMSDDWTPPAPGSYLLSVRAMSNDGLYSLPAQVRVTVTDTVSSPDNTPVPTLVDAPTQATVTPTTAPTAASPGSTRAVVATATPVRLAPATPTRTQAPQIPATATRPAPPSATLPPPVFILPTATPVRSPTPSDTQGPPPPTQTTPANGYSGMCVNITLAWRASSDPSRIRGYDIEVQHSSGRTYVTDKTWSNVTALSVVFMPPLCHTTYRWHIRATDGLGNVGNWSGYQTFTVGSQPPQ